MKKHIYTVIVVVLTVLVNLSIANAAPVSNSGASMDYAVNDQSLSGWCIGVYGSSRDRDVRLDKTNFEFELEQQKVMFYVGYSVIRSLLIYAVVGENETTPLGMGQIDPAHEIEFGGGIQLNLLDRDLPDPTLMENLFRINAGAQITHTSSEYPGFNWEWEEVMAYLTFSIVNELDGSKLFLPNAIALYVGPVYSSIISDDIEQVGDEFGYNIGMEVFFTESVSFDLGLRRFDETGFAGGLHIRF